jgi:hypothetical protein
VEDEIPHLFLFSVPCWRSADDACCHHQDLKKFWSLWREEDNIDRGRADQPAARR